MTAGHAGRRDRRALVISCSDGLVQIELAAGEVTGVPPWTNPAALTTVFPFAYDWTGVPNATNRIPTGTLLKVDGSSGKVTVLEG